MLKKLRFLIAFISLSVCLSFMSSTYSRYVASTTGDVEGLFAKWQILVSNTDITSNSTSTLTFIPTIEENANIAPNTVAPSSKGYFDINIDPSNVEVSFKYTINLGIDNTNFPDLKMTGYSIVPNNYVIGDPLEVINITDNVITNNLNYDKNTPDFKYQPIIIRVYFEWYEGENELMDDTADTTVGNAAATQDTTFTMNANISFEQIIE